MEVFADLRWEPAWGNARRRGRTGRFVLTNDLSQVDKIAAVETEGFEKGEHIGGIPSYRGVDIVDTLGTIKLYYFIGQAGTDALSHVIGINAEGGNPGAFRNAESSRENVADHKAHHFIFELRHEAGLVIFAGVVFNDLFEIIADGLHGDGCINSADLIRIFFFQSSNSDIIHR
jgi:hypothetical protein